jgi:hypothetical protein
MDDMKYKLLFGLVALTLLVSLLSLVFTMTRPSIKSGSKKVNYSGEILQTEPHLRQSPTGGRTVAVIGDKRITRQELMEQFANLPPQLAVPFVSREDTLNLLKQYVGLELIYQEAIKQGLGQDSTVLAQAREAKKQLMIDSYLAARLSGSQVPPSEEEIDQFYQANRQSLGDRKLNEVRADIVSLLVRQHQRTAYQNLVDQLWQQAQVQVYEESL